MVKREYTILSDNFIVSGDFDSLIPDSFLDLGDTPVTYSGQTGKVVAVNATEDGLEFINVVTDVSWGDITGTLSNQTDLQAALDLKADASTLSTHISDATIHFTEASISHLNIQDIGTNTHAQIDSHIASTSNPHSVTIAQVGNFNADDINGVLYWDGDSVETIAGFEHDGTGGLIVDGIQSNDNVFIDGNLLFDDPEGYFEWPNGSRFYVYSGDQSINFESAGGGPMIFNEFTSQRFGFSTFDPFNNYASASGDFGATYGGIFLGYRSSGFSIPDNTLAIEGTTSANIYLADRGALTGQRIFRQKVDGGVYSIALVSDNLLTNTDLFSISNAGTITIPALSDGFVKATSGVLSGGNTIALTDIDNFNVNDTNGVMYYNGTSVETDAGFLFDGNILETYGLRVSDFTIAGFLKNDASGNITGGNSITASDVTDFDTEVSNNVDVAANTAARHSAVTVTDSSEIDFTLVGQDITASLITGSIDILKLDAGVQTSLGLADSSAQPGDNISIFVNDSGYITGNQTITLSGDVSGSGTTSIVTTVANDSHSHTGTTISGLGVSNFLSANISQWTNDSGYLTTVDISSDTNLVAGNALTLTGDTIDFDFLIDQNVRTSDDVQFSTLVLETTGQASLILNDTSATGNPFIAFNQDGTRRGFLQFLDSDDVMRLASEYGGIAFYTGTGGTEVERVRIDEAGSVGIGTTSPGTDFLEILTVSGNSYFVSSALTSKATIEVRTDSIDGTGYGVRSIIDSSSPDSNVMYAGYFEVSATNINDSNIGLYTSASNGPTNYAIYSAAGTNHFVGAIEGDSTLDIAGTATFNDDVTMDFNDIGDQFIIDADVSTGASQTVVNWDFDNTYASFGFGYTGHNFDINVAANAGTVYGVDMDITTTGVSSPPTVYGYTLDISTTGTSTARGFAASISDVNINTGAAIYGSTNNSSTGSVSGKWAGYFDGHTHVVDSLRVGGTTGRTELTVYDSGQGASYLQASIGTTSSIAGLELFNSSDSFELQCNGDDWFWYHRTDSDYFLYYNGTNNYYGIGSDLTNPLATLHVRASSSALGSVPSGTTLAIESNTTNYITFMADSGESGNHGLTWGDSADNLIAGFWYQHSTDHFYLYHNNEYRMVIDGDGKMKYTDGSQTSATGVGLVEIETTSTFGDACLLLDQNDIDQPFIHFEGTSGVGTGNSISTQDVGSASTTGPSSSTYENDGMIRVEINGAVRWIPYYREM